jgi:Conjugative transposon protein TcpC
MNGSREVLLQRLVRGGIALIAVLLIVLAVRGLTAGGGGHGQSGSADPAAGFPQAAAEALAARFAFTYETYDPQHTEDRQLALAAFLSSSEVDPSLGWDGTGSQTARAAIPSGIRVIDARQALVTVAVLVGSGRWLYLSVPVVADQGALAVGGVPTLVPAPRKASWQPPTATDDQDSGLTQSLQGPLSGFFRAYAASDDAALRYYAAPGASISGLGGEVRFGDLHLDVAAGDGPTRRATATVHWTDAATGAGMDQAYALVLRQVDGVWHVAQAGPVSS